MSSNVFLSTAALTAILIAPTTVFANDPASNHLLIGWATADITPEQPDVLRGQFHPRVSEGILDRVTATALALEAIEKGAARDWAVLVSCDLVAIGDELRDRVREHVRTIDAELTRRRCSSTYAYHTSRLWRSVTGSWGPLRQDMAGPFRPRGRWLELAACRASIPGYAAVAIRRARSAGVEEPQARRHRLRLGLRRRRPQSAYGIRLGPVATVRAHRAPRFQSHRRIRGSRRRPALHLGSRQDADRRCDQRRLSVAVQRESVSG